MDRIELTPTCDWLTPTRVMPHPYCFEADTHPWTCIRGASPRPLDLCQLRQCATCPRWEPRTFDAAVRDLVFEAWGVGMRVPEPAGFEEAKRDMVLDAWAVE